MGATDTTQLTSLSTEDEFRLNVLLASSPRALRIDESAMTLHALNRNDTEQVMTLNPSARDEVYLKAVRNLLADKAGFPGGYPTELNRWSGTGQLRSGSLYRMLLLAEPEAVTAVSGSDELTEDLARLSWWSLPTADNGRRLLRHQVVAGCHCGQVIADHLIEYLPFETAPAEIATTVSRVLASGLANKNQQMLWWQKSQRSGAYMLGFLWALPNALPGSSEPHNAYLAHRQTLQGLMDSGDIVASMLLDVLSATGQQYIRACRLALHRPEDQDIVNALIDTMATRFAAVQPEQLVSGPTEEINSQLDRWPDLELTEYSALSLEIRALLTLSLLSYETVRPVLSKTTATGALMRRKLAPVISQLDGVLATLLGEID